MLSCLVSYARGNSAVRLTGSQPNQIMSFFFGSSDD
jgi:hypothetical protein